MYMSVNGNERYPYDYQRRALLTAIFREQMDLSDEVDPYAYKDDIYDVFLDEFATLLMGGVKAKEHVANAIEQLETVKEEFADDDRIPDMCEELIEDFDLYVRCFINREEVA